MEFTFLMCSERSGSNLITRIMDSHPEVCGPSPVHLFRILTENIMRYGDITDNENRAVLIKDIIELLDTKLGEWVTKWNFETLYRASSGKSLSGILRLIYESEAQAQGKHRLFIKENHSYRYYRWLKREFPNSRFVWMVRDPRDMALSWKLSPNLRGSVIRATKTWQEDQSQSMKLYLAAIPDEVTLLRYEDLLTTAEKSLHSICQNLKLAFNPEMLAFFQASATRTNARKSKDWQNLEKPLMQKNFNKYSSGLNRDEIRYIESQCAAEMDFLGYNRDWETLGDADALELEIEPLEVHEKPEYQKLPEAERTMRAKRYEVEKRIKARNPERT